MKLLNLTNFYPPAARGGYEQWCLEVTEGFRSRDHQVRVLTSDYQRELINNSEPDWIHRTLHLEMEIESIRNSIGFFTTRKAREQNNLSQLRNIIDTFKPDFILVWGMWNLPRSLPALAEKLMPNRVVYYIGDYWATLPSQWENYWQALPSHWYSGIPKRLLRTFARQKIASEKLPSLRFEHVLFPTIFMQKELKHRGITPINSKIVSGAVNTGIYSTSSDLVRGINHNKPVTLLYAGRLTPEKGVEVALEALNILVNQYKIEKLKLIVAGTGGKAYEEHLYNIVRHRKIDGFVNFIGSQTKEQMPLIYRQADILLFTSLWPEPFGRVIVEAMASGTVVIGSPVGGAAEILRDEDTALCFPPGDASALAEKINNIINNPLLYKSISKKGYDTAIRCYDIQTMTSKIEEYLLTIIISQ